MRERMEWFFRGVDSQCIRHSLSLELIIVDWNPLANKSGLSDLLPKPSSGSPLTVRYIIVPPSIHNRWDNSDRIPLFQMIGKNVGIRRAGGDFVLATNVDVLFSDELCRFLKEEDLKSSTMYRANRCDVPLDVLHIADLDIQLEYARTHILKRFGQVSDARFGCCVRRWFRKQINSCISRNDPEVAKVDTDACGDFTLMSKDMWTRVRGYPELGLYSIYVDGLACHAAVACGALQQVLPPSVCLFHAEHESGWATMNCFEKVRFGIERPMLDYLLYSQWVAWMHSNHDVAPWNSSDWGCANEELDEVCFRG